MSNDSPSHQSTLNAESGGTMTDLSGTAEKKPVVVSDALVDCYRGILQAVGEDVEREGLVKTPARAAAAMQFFTQGYQLSLDELLNGAIFNEDNNNMVLLRNIEFYSNCEHHMVPFFGKCHIAYIPNGKIVGVSKMARIVDMFARRLQVQERMTNQIADAIEDALQPLGVGVVAEGVHLCMVARGVEKQHSTMTTSAMRGVFNDMPT
ncbi:MAG: cyclohydrolase, partial [Abditibacteriota bacterium]|nr:cyclohydrolase [Abditibacteriota bacterium]